MSICHIKVKPLTVKNLNYFRENVDYISIRLGESKTM